MAASTNAAPAQELTEDEAALYDRQVRLWGLEAQNKMRNASVLIITLRGIAVEVVKNIVLAGVGSITILDDQEVKGEDLGANYFVREEEVGLKRVEAAAPRIQALNPRVKVTSETDMKLLDREDYISAFDLIVLTEPSAAYLRKFDEVTRRCGVKMIAAASVGIDGWIFTDLLEHEFMVDKIKTVGPGEVVKVPTKVTQSFPSFDDALRHDFKGTAPRAMKRISPGLWSILTIFVAQLSKSDDEPLTIESLTKARDSHLPSRGVIPSLLTPEVIGRIASTSTFEFPPSTAIIGGIVGQDVLNALGGKEEPVRNLLVFEGETGAGTVNFLGAKGGKDVLLPGDAA